MNAITKIEQPQTMAVSHNPLIPTDMNSAIRLAEIMATGKLVPAHLQNRPGDCLMVIEQAIRWGMSPFAVAQCTSVIGGKLMYEGKLVAAVVQSAPGVMASRFHYEFSGEGDDRQITASGVMRSESKPKSVTVVLKNVRTSNEMWKKQPDQQLVYSANRIWARRYAPEVMLGVYSPDEIDRPPVDDFWGQTIDAAPVRQEPPPPPPQQRQQQPPQRRAPDPAPAAPPVEDAIPNFDMPPPGANEANAIMRRMEAATTLNELETVSKSFRDQVKALPDDLRAMVITTFNGCRHGFEKQVEAAIS